MRLLVSSFQLARMGGLETYTLTLAEHLALLGHEVSVFTPKRGDVAAEMARRGISVVDEARLPTQVDVVLPQESMTALSLAEAYPGVPQVQAVHAHEWDFTTPSQLHGVTAAALVMSDTVARAVRSLAHPPRVVRLTQPVDTRRFRPVGAPRAKARRVLLLSNYVHGSRLQLFERACDTAGLELVCIGSQHSSVADVAWPIAECDIVVGKARAILEGMACGRAAYIFDHNGCDGWVTAESYAQLEADNFGGRMRGNGADLDLIVSELAGYRPEMGLVNRDLVLAHHSAREHAQAVTALCAEMTASGATPTNGLREMSRLVWMQYQTELRALRAEDELRAVREREWLTTEELRLEIQRLQAKVEEEARVAADAPARVAALEAEMQTVRSRLADAAARAAHANEKAQAIVSTRRYRLMEATLRPLDTVRGRRRSASPANPPSPFVVGVARSGTTLLRLMLDAHPELAIPAETGWIPSIREISDSDPTAAERFCATVCAFATFPDSALSRENLTAEVMGLEVFSVAEATRAFFRLYARQRGKRRWGDKTPAYGAEMEAICALLSEARFVHIIRDGRDVAVSVRPLWFSPGKDISTIARDWCERVMSYRAAGERLGVKRYLELRYEDLIVDPETELRRIGKFLDLPYSADMLAYHRTSRNRLDELATRYRGDGSILISKEERLRNQRFTASAPDPSRIGRWHTELTPPEQSEFETVAGDVLRRLGYLA